MTVSCIAIPDGVVLSTDGKSAVFRVSLLLSPTLAGDLSRWPEEISARTFHLKLHGADGKPSAVPPIAATDPDFKRAPQEAGDLWRRIFADQFDTLRGAFASPSSPPGSFAVTLGDQRLDAEQVFPSLASDVGDIIDEAVIAEVSRSLALAFLRKEEPITQAALKALERSTVAGDPGAARAVMTAHLKAPFAVASRLKTWMGHRRFLGPKNVTDSERAATRAAQAAAPPVKGFASELNKEIADNQAALLRLAKSAFSGAALAATAKSATPLREYRPHPTAGADGAFAPDQNWLTKLESLLMIRPQAATRSDRDSAIEAYDRATAPDPRVAPFEDGKGGVADDRPGELELVQRKLVGLEAFPTVRKFLRMIADVEITVPLSELGEHFATHNKRYYGYVSATASGTPADAEGECRTAFVFDSQNLVFEPCPSYEMADPAIADAPGSAPTVAEQVMPLHAGVLKLHGSEGRFKLDTIDVAAGRRSFMSAASATLEAVQNGASEDSIQTALPDIRTQGLAVVDTAAHPAATLSLAKFALQIQQGKPEMLYAEDLVSGFRVDIIHDKPGQPSKAFSATDRDLIHTQLNEAFKQPVPKATDLGLPWHPYSKFRDRDSGFVAQMDRVREELGVDGKTPVTKSFPAEHLFVWTGDPLAIPSQPPPDGLAPTDPDDLLVNVRYQMPAATPGLDRRLPAFRIGKPVRVVMRVRKPNGGSVPLLRIGHLRDWYALGAGDGAPTRDRPYVLTRSERTQPPEVLYRRADLSKQPEGYVVRPENWLQSDGPDTLIVKTAKVTPRSKVSRILLAPRTDFTSAEQEGLFDPAVPGDVPTTDGVYLKLDLDKGRIRQALANVQPDPKATTRLKDVGLAFVTQLQATRRADPYHVDAAGQYMAFSLRQGDTTANLTAPGGVIAFWQGRPTNDNVKPVLLEVRPAEPEKAVISIDKDDVSDGQGIFYFYDSPRIIVRLPQAAECELDLWTFPNLDDALNRRRYFRRAALPLLLQLGGIGQELGVVKTRILQTTINVLASLDVAASPADVDAAKSTLPGGNLAAEHTDLRDRWIKLASTQPVTGLTSVKTLKLVHAVDRPLDMPRFVDLNGAPLVLVRLEANTAVDWEAFVAKTPDPAAWRSQRGGLHLYVGGALKFDRKSTDRVWCEAAWVDHRVEAAVCQADGAPALEPTSPEFAPTSGGPWRYLPTVRNETLFDISGIPRRDADPEANRNRLDLVRDDAGVVRGLIAPLKDTKAHRLALRLVGASRFAHLFPATLDPDAFEDAYCLSSASRADLRKAARQKWVPPLPLGVREIWVQATERPKPLEGLTASYSLPVEEKAKTAVSLRVEYRPLVRLDLGREWFTSGDGELLAVVCRPADLVDNLAPAPDPARPARLRKHVRSMTGAEPDRSAALKELGPVALDSPIWLSSLVTRWGRDPTTDTNALKPYVIPPDAFSGHVAKAQDLPLPKKRPPDSASLAAQDDVEKVSIFAYEPRWDSATGSWFVEIELETFQTMSPFVRFGLARYQPNAPAELRLSEAVALPELEIPSAWTVELSRTPGAVTVRVLGDSFTKRAPGFIGLNAQHNATIRENLPRTQYPNLQFELGVIPVAGRSSVQAVDDWGRRLDKIVTEPVAAPEGWTWSHTFHAPDAERRTVTISEIMLDVDSRAALGDKDAPPLVARRRPFSITLEI